MLGKTTEEQIRFYGMDIQIGEKLIKKCVNMSRIKLQ
jgi:hypothetical protein